jgi:hypothetical protein
MRLTFLTIAFSLFILDLNAQVLANNPCGLPGTSQFSIGVPCVNVSTFGMTPLFTPPSCNAGGFDDGWGWFIGNGQPLTVTFAATTGDPVLHVFEASVTPGCTVNEVGCSDVTFGGGTESVTFNSVNGQLYFFRLQNWGTNATMTGCIDIVTPVGGCTNPAASNYNPLATFDDGTCTFPGVDYTHPTQGGAGEFVGACLVNDCGPFVYTDNGGPAGNYSNNIEAPGFGGIYRVFCPDAAGQCMQVTFNSFNLHNPAGTANDDYLTIGNGPTQNSPFFTTPPAQASGQITGTPAVPFTYTSTDASGCLTFRFRSNPSITRPGWSATMQCVPCAGGPNGTDNNDCINATAICSNANFGANSTGPGLNSDGCTFGSCPAGGENFTNWYFFEIATSGTLDITITPQVMTDDYDFAVYGPNVSCAALGDPLRCSDAALTGITGTGGDTDFSEPAAGNAQVATMNVVAGEQYILVVDEWSPTGAGFDLSFAGSSATLDCSVLPVELAEFTAEYAADAHAVDLFWKTASEMNNAYWEIERSTDGVNWEIINRVDGAGTTTNETQYYVMDENPNIGVNYYRLNQWDHDGNGDYSEIRSVNILDDIYDLLTIFPNPTNGVTEVIFNNYKKEEVQLTVSTYDGKKVVDMPLNAVPGANRFEVDLSGLKGNIYFVTITSSNKTYTGKVIKQ